MELRDLTPEEINRVGQELQEVLNNNGAENLIQSVGNNFPNLITSVMETIGRQAKFLGLDVEKANDLAYMAIVTTLDMLRRVPLIRGEKAIQVQSLFGGRCKEPLVGLIVGSEQLQISPTKAQELAMMLLEASESSVTDGFMYYFIREQLKGTEAQAAVMMNDFRQYREAQNKRNIEVENE